MKARPVRTGFVVSTLAMMTAAWPASAQIVAPAGRTLFNEGVLIRSLLRYDTFDETAPGQEVERWRNVWAVVWGARPRLSLSLTAPLIRLEMPGPLGEHRRTRSGDATLFARYDAWRKLVPGGYTRLAPEIGVKLPTGGAFSTGSTDLLAGLVLSHVRGANWWIGDVQWSRFGDGDGGLRRGDRWRADLAYLRRLVPSKGPGVPMLLWVAELNFETAGSSRRAGATISDSGGDVLFFSPGAEWIISRRIVLEAAVPIAVRVALRGDQPRPDKSMVMGVRWLF